MIEKCLFPCKQLNVDRFDRMSGTKLSNGEKTGDMSCFGFVHFAWCVGWSMRRTAVSYHEHSYFLFQRTQSNCEGSLYILICWQCQSMLVLFRLELPIWRINKVQTLFKEPWMEWKHKQNKDLGERLTVYILSTDEDFENNGFVCLGDTKKTEYIILMSL